MDPAEKERQRNYTLEQLNKFKGTNMTATPDNTEIRNVQITKTFLGIEGHGMTTAILTTDSGCSVQGFGTHDLNYAGYGIGYIEEILKVFGVEKWEDIVGKYARVKSRDGLLVAIGHIIEDRWFEPQEYAKGRV
jgi:hypothetical protein